VPACCASSFDGWGCGFAFDQAALLDQAKLEQRCAPCWLPVLVLHPPLCAQDCVQKTITRMEQKLSGAPRVLASVVYMLRSDKRAVRQRAALALAKLAPEPAIKSIFVDKRGLDVLLDMLVDQVQCSTALGWRCRSRLQCGR
jgi:hypothetical protein